MTRQREEQVLRIAVYAIRPLLRYATFTGRASRGEFGWFTLLVLSLLALAQTFDWLLFGPGSWPAAEFFTKVCSLVLVLPSAALITRRLHDIDRSGWWLLLLFVPVVGWVLMLLNCLRPGRRGGNAYGAPPRRCYRHFHLVYL